MANQESLVARSVCLLACLGACTHVQAERITGPRALGDVADRLEAAWGRPVTYEEPLWLHSSGISAEGDPVLKTLAPRFRSVTLPAAALRNRDRRRDLEYGRAIVAAFNREHAPLEFAMVESKWGLHIVPVRVRDQLGTPGPAAVLLDAAVTVRREARAPFQHVDALARALGWRERIRVEASSAAMRFDALFAAPGSNPVFEWGAEGVTGRDALIDLLSRGRVRCSWRLNCQPATPGVQSAFCVLNVSPVRRD